METLAWACLALAIGPAGLCLINLLLYRAPPPGASAGRLSLLIPARNEEGNVGQAIRSALSEPSPDLEVVVLDDHSEDRTSEIVREIAAADPRVRLEMAPPLPPGWSGKQHACQVLAQSARHDALVFMDADVRLAPGALGRIAAFLEARPKVGLASGFPREETGSLGEALVIPVIHFLLLSFLPLACMRLFKAPGFGAGCGQLIAVRREAYEAAGGHAAIRDSLHDGVKLPRAVRRAGWFTDLFDATELASCRMYRGWAEVWSGFGKNATEGMASPVQLPIWTLLLGLPYLLPLPLLLFGIAAAAPDETLSLLALALGLGIAHRLVLAEKFQQSRLSALLHPLGIALTLAIQWTALARKLSGRRATWRGRSYPAA